MTPLELSKHGVRTLPLERRNAQCNALSHILSLCHHLLKCLCINYTLWKYNTPNSQLRNNPYPDTLPVKMVVCSHLLAFSEIAHSDYCFILSFTMSFLLALHLFIKKYIFIHFWLSLVIVVACGLRSTWDGDSPARDGTHIPCIGRQILKIWTTREVPCFVFRLVLKVSFSFLIFCLVIHSILK